VREAKGAGVTDLQRQRIFDALRGPIISEDKMVNAILDDISLTDANELEPVVDAIIKEVRDEIAQKERRFFVALLLEIADAHTNETKSCPDCRHSLKNNEHGFDQNDADMDGDVLVHSGQCTYCRECNPKMFEAEKK